MTGAERQTPPGRSAAEQVASTSRRSWRRRSALVVGTAGLAAGLVLAGGVLLAPGTGSSAPPSSAPAPAGGAVDPLSRRVAQLDARVQRLPGDWSAWAALGAARLEQARVTADPTRYPQAEAAFRRSLAVEPEGNADALAGLAALAAARHDFARAAALAREAVAVDPYDAAAHGALFDGLVELGRYEQAAAALQRMADLSPGPAALVRVAYLRELHGDVTGARTALEQALAGAAGSADTVYALQQLGDLAASQGDLDTAQARYAEGLRNDPGNLPLLVGTAEVAAARGRGDEAVAVLRRVVDALPTAGHAAALGDLLASLGRTQEAERQYDLVDAATRLAVANGGSADLESALFAADHGEPEAALAAATAEHRRRQDVFADDALAWALHVNGRSAEALPLARRALRLGTRSAPLHFHLGMIEAALGDVAAARTSLATALRIDPHFSVRHAPVARETLDELVRRG